MRLQLEISNFFSQCWISRISSDERSIAISALGKSVIAARTGISIASTEKSYFSPGRSRAARERKRKEKERGAGRGIETSSTGRERVEAIGNIRRIAGRCAVS